MKRWDVQYKEIDGNRFYYIDVGSGAHGKISFRLWISSKLVQEEEGSLFIEFPLHAQIIKTEKGNYVLKPGNGIVYDVYVPCGYRGTSEVRIKLDDPNLFIVNYIKYSSPLGRLGVSSGAIVYSPNRKPITVIWYRTGKLYGEAAEGIMKLYPDGRVEEIDHIDDLNELKDIVE